MGRIAPIGWGSLSCTYNSEAGLRRLDVDQSMTGAGAALTSIDCLILRFSSLPIVYQCPGGMMCPLPFDIGAHCGYGIFG